MSAYILSVEDDARQAILQIWDYAEGNLRTQVVNNGWAATITQIQPDDWEWLEQVASRIVTACEERKA